MARRTRYDPDIQFGLGMFGRRMRRPYTAWNSGRLADKKGRRSSLADAPSPVPLLEPIEVPATNKCQLRGIIFCDALGMKGDEIGFH